MYKEAKLMRATRMQASWLLTTLLVPLLAVGCGPADTAEVGTAELGATGGGTLGTQAVARLTTPWTAAALNAPVPLPEYPRPQLTRSKWLNLNGKWSLNAGANAPNAENAPATAPGFPATPEQILVPYPVESYLSGVQRSNQRNMWYRRSFTVPQDWAGQRVLLNFGAVDRLATVYVNGQKVGGHSGGYDAFSFDVTPFLRPGSNELVVGVFDPTDGSDMLGKQTLTPGGIFYTATSGIWQTVWLEPVAQQHISRLDMIPDLSTNTLRVTVRGDALAAGQSASVTVLDGSNVVGSGSGPMNQEFRISIPNPHLWSPSDPFLYDVRAEILQGTQVIDQAGSYTGMRSLSIGTVNGVPRPLLNGKFVFQSGTLDQGFWPDGLYTAPTDEALKSDLVAHKDLGFNMVRKHIKVEPQRWFYWADKLGLLVWQDMPHAWDADTNTAVQAKVENEVREIVGEHLSSPSVATWVMFNESWGDFNIPGVLNTIRGLDSSRLINAHSGINFNPPGDPGVGDLIDLHAYPGPSSPAYQALRPAVLGEYGGNCLNALGHRWNTNSKCPYTVYPDSNTLTNVVVAQLASLRKLSISRGLSASVYTEISDIEDEENGFLTYDRQIRKMDFARIKAANQALYADLPPPPPAPVLNLGNASLQVSNVGLTNRYVRHTNSLGVTEVVNAGSSGLLKADATFNIVRGLADSKCYSFQSNNFPNSYLRHQGFRVKLAATENNDTYRHDATWCAQAGLSGAGVSFESSNFPGSYLRHINAELWLAQSGGPNRWDSSNSFEDDVSWNLVAPWVP